MLTQDQKPPAVTTVKADSDLKGRVFPLPKAYWPICLEKSRCSPFKSYLAQGGRHLLHLSFSQYLFALDLSHTMVSIELTVYFWDTLCQGLT